jgi:hypothetical protein
VHDGHEVMMEVGGNISLIVSIPQGILDPQLSPHPGPIIKYYHYINEGKSAAIFRHQVAAWFSAMFCNYNLVKTRKIAKTSITTKDRVKNKHRFEILRILGKFS